MCAWHDERSRRARSRSRPRARPQTGVQYVSAYPQSSNYAPSAESSSDYSSSDDFRNPHSIHVPANRGGRMRLPRAPAAPGSPSGPPSLDSSLDSPSSMTSSGMYRDYTTISPQLAEPEIFDPHSYTGAYGYGAHQDRFAPPPRPASAMKRKPAPMTVNVPPPPPMANISHEPNCIIAEPDSPTTSRRGGPKARSYLDADAPQVEVVEVHSQPPLSPTGPTQADAHARSSMVYQSYYPQQPPPQQMMHRHPHHPGVEAPEAQWFEDEDDQEDYEPIYRRPRNQVRHIPVESRPRSRSRARSRGAPSSRGGGSVAGSQIEIIEYERRHRHRHRSRSRHHRHRSRGPGEEEKKRSAELQAQIDALTTRLSNIMDDPYAQDIIASEGIKFDVLYSAAK
ncbi:hypothetical protein BZA05DRAFT_400660 [Tricharina praecox]|uniref:uncharacterized protein n=1 Tax=Tricharina praecox TaxID=43433 RepID=UPI002220406E|nr:uncharacterized protein BZA05DRAFT_400660 [Tricharina praecox]KAI5850025.1 hypothetical protein BZA05DRAFT_400660 [Tricharina praecox]